MHDLVAAARRKIASWAGSHPLSAPPPPSCGRASRSTTPRSSPCSWTSPGAPPQTSCEMQRRGPCPRPPGCSLHLAGRRVGRMDCSEWICSVPCQLPTSLAVLNAICDAGNPAVVSATPRAGNQQGSGRHGRGADASRHCAGGQPAGPRAAAAAVAARAACSGQAGQRTAAGGPFGQAARHQAAHGCVPRCLHMPYRLAALQLARCVPALGGPRLRAC